MTQRDTLFLQALKAALLGRQVDWDQPISADQWAELLALADSHKVLPMIYQAVYACLSAASMPPELSATCRARVRRLVMLQAQKTESFRELLKRLESAGAAPLVVKGIICRELYPNPDHRMSADEDLLIPKSQFQLCHRVLTEMGMTTPDPEGRSYETPYTRPGSTLYLEIHTSLFPPDSSAFREFNRYFRDAHRRAVRQNGVPTLEPTEHLLFLILHAFKHFLHSGFGIRQVCDIILCANTWGPEIDWQWLLETCRTLRAEQFAAGLFRIGWKHLGFSLERSGYPLNWQAIYVEELPLLQDILSSGVYGSADRSRQHSSTITLRAVETRQNHAAGGVLRSVFPPVSALEQRYSYLQGKPWLLPVAWTERLVRYGRETRTTANNDPGSSIRIGKERVELLKKYGILDKK